MTLATARRKFLCFNLMLLVFSWAGPAVLAATQDPTALPEPDGKVILAVHGAITNTNADGAALFDRAMLEALPETELVTHTSVTDGAHVFTGFLLRDLLQRVGAMGTSATATALNDYAITIAVEEFFKYDVIAAYAMDGRTLQPSDKGPLWLVYPRDQHPELQDIRYDYRWVWQLVRLDIQ